MELTDRQIDLMRAEAQALGLSGAELITNNSNKLIRKACNGIGPSGFPAWARRRLDRLLPHITLPALIHDLRYWYGTGSYDDFAAANAELAFNAELVAWRGIKWWRVLRKLLVLWAGARCANACDRFGWRAYCAAIQERREDEDAKFMA